MEYPADYESRIPAEAFEPEEEAADREAAGLPEGGDSPPGTSAAVAPLDVRDRKASKAGRALLDTMTCYCHRAKPGECDCIDARVEAAELRTTFNLRWKADMRAIKQWQASNPGNDLVWPDHADLVVWLLKQRAAIEAKARAEGAAAERDRIIGILDGAANALPEIQGARADKKALSQILGLLRRAILDAESSDRGEA